MPGREGLLPPHSAGGECLCAASRIGMLRVSEGEKGGQHAAPQTLLATLLNRCWSIPRSGLSLIKCKTSCCNFRVTGLLFIHIRPEKNRSTLKNGCKNREREFP